MSRFGFALTSVLGVATLAPAQSFNINIGPPGVAPSSAYGGAANQPGFWNPIEAQHATTAFNLSDINGVETPVQVRQIGGMLLRTFDDPATTGDAAALMDHCQVTFSATLETCIFVDFLEPGEYEVIIYAWMPGQPNVRAMTFCDEEPGQPRKIVQGGAWPGDHVELVTYSRHVGIVGANRLLRFHSGVVFGDSAALGAAMNGFQLRKIPPFLPGDANCDGVFSVADIAGFVLALTDPAGYAATFPDCEIASADLNSDGFVTVTDIGPFVQLLTN